MEDVHFYEWRLEVQKIQTAIAHDKANKANLEALKKEITLKELELTRLREELRIKSGKLGCLTKAAQKLYEEFMTRFEKKIGYSLKDKFVNDFTKEISNL